MSDPASEAAERIAELERSLAEAVTTIEQLEEALRSRDMIGQAKGVLMERDYIDADAAFDQLVELSRRRNQKVRVIAEKIAAEASRSERK